MEKVSCQKTGTLIDIDKAQELFHIADETCKDMCTNYETCTKQFWDERTIIGG